MRRPALLFAALAVLAAVSCSPRPSSGNAGAGASASPAPAVSAASGPMTDLLRSAGLDVPTRELMSEDFTLESLDGPKVSLSSYRGKVVLLSFWATWCGPCKLEMPEMEKLYARLKGKGLEIVAVDMMEDRATVRSFLKANGYTFPVLLDSQGEVGGSPLYSARAIPTNYVIDREGRIVARKIGVDGPGWTSAERVALFEKLLAQ